jgi:Uri superfamily endonuclease
MRLKGGYALLLQTFGWHTINTRKRQFVLPAGAYIYAGSALGPGGIEARIKRHLRLFYSNATDHNSIKTMAKSNKNTINRGYHWHIDQLLRIATTFTTIYAGSECRTECLLTRYLKGHNLQVIVGFGSTDCSSGCGGHLLYLTAGEIKKARELAIKGFKHLGLKPIVGKTYKKRAS